jgi:hypothetical protein
MPPYVAPPRAGYTEGMIALQATPSTVQQTNVPLAQSTSGTWPVWIVDSVEDDEAEEREWDSIVHKPHVRQALRRMAAEARLQYYAGETEEGGFAVE